MSAGTVAAVVSIAVGVCAFVGTWIKIGIDKGRTDQRITDVEKDTEDNEASVKELAAKFDVMKDANTRLTSELNTNINWIKESLVDIKKKLNING